jgi:hypothetical protein
MLRRLLPLACAAALGACVSVNEAPLAPDAIAKDQLVVAAVYASPGPVMAEKSSNMDNLAKVVPGMSLFMSATQNGRDLDASNDLQRYLPSWKPGPDFLPLLMKELATSGNPGRLAGPAEAGLTDEVLAGFNHADDVTNWQVRYCVANPDDPTPRHYGAVPGLKGALVLEVNLAYGAPGDGAGRWTPTLDAVTKLVRVSDLAVLWRREDSVADAAGMKTPAEFERTPADLIAKWEALMPQLAQAVAAGFKSNLQAAGLYVAPVK